MSPEEFAKWYMENETYETRQFQKKRIEQILRRQRVIILSGTKEYPIWFGELLIELWEKRKRGR